MASVLESQETKVIETESIIKECRERIKQALEGEGNQLKEKAEREASRIVARAKEEADNNLAQAKQEAKVESEKIITRAKTEARQITKESREESAKVFNETRNKVLQTITEVMASNMIQAQEEITRASSEARTRTSQLLAQIGQSIDQIIDDTETHIKVELERLRAVETKLPLLKEEQDKGADAKSSPVIDEEIAPITSIPEKTKGGNPLAGVSVASNNEGDDSRLFKGHLTLEMISPFGQEHYRELPEQVSRLRGLKVRSTDGFVKANRWVTKYTLDLEQSMPIMEILEVLPQVKDISRDKEKIVVTLK